MTPQFLLDAPVADRDEETGRTRLAEPTCATAASGARITREAGATQPLVAVVGLGHAGLPSAIALRSAGFRIVGIDSALFRRRIFIMTAVLAALFGIVESPLTGFTYQSGPTISLIGVVAAGFAAFRRPGRAVVVGLVLGVAEAMLGGYVSTEYNDVLLYAILFAILILQPEILGLSAALA